MVLLAVLGSLLTAIVMYVISSADVLELAQGVTHYFGLAGEARIEERHYIVSVLVIFPLGLYELFISRLDPAIEDEISAKVLIIHSLDDLKTRLGKVILMILIVNFFQYGISIQVETPMDLLAFGGGIALIGLALYLTHNKTDH